MCDEWPGQSLHRYAIFDRHDALLGLLQGEERRNINARDACGRTPVYTAVSNNSIECLQILLQHGADPSIPGGERVSKMTPLHQALIEDKSEAIKLLLEYGADLDSVDATGLSPLTLAKSIACENYFMMFEIEEENRRRNALQVVKELYEDCENNDLQSVKVILMSPPPCGLDLPNTEVQGKKFKTPLIVTAHAGHVEIMKELLHVVNEFKYSSSVIHIATEYGHLDIVQLLLQQFPECCQCISEFNEIPFHLACKTGYLELVKLLLEWTYPNWVYQTYFDQQNKVEYLLPFPVNMPTRDGKTGLYLACEFGHQDVVEYLVTFTRPARKEGHQQRVFASDLSSSHACKASHVQNNGAAINFRPVQIDGDRKLYQPSAQAADFEKKVVYKVNTDSGMSVSLSCVWVAVKNRHLRIVEILAKAGAIMTLTEHVNNSEYSSLLWLALKNGDLLMLDRLLHLGVPDLNNAVFEEAIRSKSEFVLYFLKYKASEDKESSINKVLMKNVYASKSVSREKIEELHSNDQKYRQIFPVEAVMIRWQNLKVLSSVDPVWLSQAVSLFNPDMNTFNTKISLFAITKVDISNNSLPKMPMLLLQLPSLCTLSAAHNQIIEFPSWNFKHECHFLEYLNIQSNKLTTIPGYIFTLPKIKFLNASSNQINVLPVEIWQTTNLQTLDLSGNMLENLPPPPREGVLQRKESEVLENDIFEIVTKDLDQPQSNIDSHVIIQPIKRVSYWASNVTINDNAVRSPENHTRGLKTLKLGKNQFKCFPDFLSCCCPTLENLEMSYNMLESVGNLCAYPKLLKTLVLSHNLISSMYEWQEKDVKQKCYCSNSRALLSRSGCFVGSLPMSCAHRLHCKLENLESLNISNNKLSTLVLMQTKNISPVNSLEQQSFQDKEMAEKTIQSNLLFPNLSSLNVAYNQLTTITEDIKELKQLAKLNLKKNETLKELPPSLGLLEKLHRIELESCPIEGPIQDVIKRASDRAGDILGFLRSILEEAEEYNCMNLMIVGSFNVGKTTLLEQLVRKGKSSTPKTHFVQRKDKNAPGTTNDGKPLATVGIDISNLILEGKHGAVEFRTWDFAGQKEYYATHQYFLSPRSLYLVVWNLKKGESGVDGLRHWLVNIQARAPGAPVIVVGTHLDEIQKNKKCFSKDWEETLTAKIRQKYQNKDKENVGLPNVLDIINVGTRRMMPNIGKLKDIICEKVFSLKHPARRNENLLGHKVPKKYILLQDCIARIVKKRKAENKEPVLDASSYLLSVMEEMSEGDKTIFRNKDDLYQATRFLHENGVLCHFEDTSLHDQYYLDPQWLCDQLAKVISIHEVQKFSKKGVMKITDLNGLYNNSDIGKYILSLLNKFEIALQFDDHHLLLPSLLPTHQDVDPSQMKEIPLKQKTDSNSAGSNKFMKMSGFDASILSATSLLRNMSVISTQATENVLFSNVRLYLLTYVPSGFWPRLITRILADESFFEPAMKLFKIPQKIKDKCTDFTRTLPCWRCWQMGLELVYFHNVIMQIKEISADSIYTQGICNYAFDGLSMKWFFDDRYEVLNINDNVILEISFKADKLTFNIENNESDVGGIKGVNSIDAIDIYHNKMAKVAILAKIVVHIDSLLQDWFPEIGESRFIQSCSGRYQVIRVVPCPRCLQTESCYQENMKEVHKSTSINQPRPVSMASTTMHASKDVGLGKADNRVMYTFLVEKCIQNVLEGMNEICAVHGVVSPLMMSTDDGSCRIMHITPDALFQDLDESFIVKDDSVHVTGTLGQGAFGKVSAGKLRQADGTEYKVAVKVLYDAKEWQSEQRKQSMQMSLETICSAYTTARQEVSILLTMEHPNIVPLLGLSLQPLALLLSLAPKGSLTDIMEERHRIGFHFPVWVIKQVVIQTADALDYLHGRTIIYRDLKSDNVLVWYFPDVNDLDPRQPVLIKLADYGISRSVLPTGAKGFGGTPPFIAPEILMHLGKDTYTSKVDIFSFGMFMFELLTCRKPLEEINNINMHVIHGGRPTLTNKDAVYPSPMLDLMTICWDHKPENRPSAEQICMIASTPQFCHLSDAITLANFCIDVSACSVYLGDTSLLKHVSEPLNDHTQVWIASQIEKEYKLNILSYDNNNKCVEVVELKQTGIVATCNVNNRIWCLDNQGVMYIYSPTTLDQEHKVQLDVGMCFKVVSMSYHHGNGGYIIILAQDKSTVFFCFTEDMIKSPNKLKPHRIPKHCFCVTVVRSLNSLKVWFGSSKGQIWKRPTDDLEKDEGSISPYNEPNLMQDCYLLTSGVTSLDSHDAWSYSKPGGKVFHWNTDQEKVRAYLDCSSIIPAADRYNVQKARLFQAKDFQVTALTVIHQYLYISTTWGCVIVADAKCMNPLNVFRCHGNEGIYCNAILPLGTLCLFRKRCAVTEQTAVLNFTSGNSNNIENEVGGTALQHCGVVTIGYGYLDIISHVTQLDKKALLRRETDKRWSVPVIEPERRNTILGPSLLDIYILSWDANHWEYY